MTQEQLPGASNAVTMGVIGLVLAFCCWPAGVIFSIIALNGAKKADKLHQANPDAYSGHENVKTAKILSYIGIALSIIFLVLTILYFAAIFAYLGMEGFQSDF
ncbi:MAG: CCC motif membrane protein [Aurantibacter sp.]